MDFRCSADSGQETFFACQHQANCTLDLLKGEICAACPPGWEHDVYGFGHFYNCATPSIVPLVFCVFQGCVLGLGMILVGYLFRTEQAIRGKTRTILLMNLTCAVLSWCSLLSLYLQRGLYEGSLVSLLILGTIGFFIAPNLIPVLLRPVASMTSNLAMLRTVTKLSWTLAITTDMLFFGLMVAALATCRDENPRLFNTFALAAIWLTLFVLNVQGVGVIFVSRRLARVIGIFSSKSEETDGGSPTAHVRMSEAFEQRQKLILAQLAVISSFVGFLMFGLVLLLVPVVLWSIYGSLPYLWVFHLGGFSITTCTFPLVIPFVRGSSQAAPSARNMVSSSGQGHIISEGVDVVEIPQFRGLGIKKKVRKNPPWKIRVGKILSRISEEQSRVESSIASIFMVDQQRLSSAEPSAAPRSDA